MSSTATYLLETLATLGLLLGAAVLVLFALRRSGVAGPRGPLELVGRLPLDARRSLYAVRVGPVVLVVGASEGGLVKLTELPGQDVPTVPAGPAPRFADVLARFARAPQASPASVPPPTAAGSSS